MDPNTSSWSYAYNRIVPTATANGSAEEYQHSHFAAGQGAQSLILHAAHTGLATANGSTFVTPSPITSYNPVFQQIYHHAATGVMQSKSTQYASGAVNISPRVTLDKQLPALANPTATTVVSSKAIATNIVSAAYKEESPTNRESPALPTAAIASSTLNWNAPPMVPNTFLTMHQHQSGGQQQPQLNLSTEKVTQLQEIGLPHAVINSPQQMISTDQFYSIDGKNYKVIRKQVHEQAQILPVVTSAVNSTYGGSALSGTRSHSTGAVIRAKADPAASHIIVYKTNAANISNDCGSDASTNGTESPVKYTVSAGSPTRSGVVYSSVIQSTLQPQLSNPHTQASPSSTTSSNSWSKIENSAKRDSKTIVQLGIKEPNQLSYSANLSACGDNLVFNLPPGLEIKQTHQHPNNVISAPIVHHAVHNEQPNGIIQQIHGNNIDDKKLQCNDKPYGPYIIANMIVSSTANTVPQRLLQYDNQPTPAATVLPSPVQETAKTSRIATNVNSLKSAKVPRRRQPKSNSLESDYIAEHSSHQENGQQQHQQKQPTHYEYHNKTNAPLKLGNNSAAVGSASPGPTIMQYPHLIAQPGYAQATQSETSTHLLTSMPYNTLPYHYATCVPQTSATSDSGAGKTTSADNFNHHYHHQLTNVQNQHQQQQSQHQQQHQQQQQQLQQPQQTTAVSVELHNSSQITQENQTESSHPNAISAAGNGHVVNKVIVPNVEEELQFLNNPEQCYANAVLSDTNADGRNSKEQLSVNNNSLRGQHMKLKENRALCVGTSIGEKKTQFMDSYLRFLQGNRDSSPPPVVKSGRRVNYQKPTVSPGQCAIRSTPIKSNSKVSCAESGNESQSPKEQSDQISMLHCSSNGVGDNCDNVKIISQTQILPKKRSHTQTESPPPPSTIHNTNSMVKHNAESNNDRVGQQQQPPPQQAKQSCASYQTNEMQQQQEQQPQQQQQQHQQQHHELSNDTNNAIAAVREQEKCAQIELGVDFGRFGQGMLIDYQSSNNTSTAANHVILNHEL